MVYPIYSKFVINLILTKLTIKMLIFGLQRCSVTFFVLQLCPDINQAPGTLLFSQCHTFVSDR